MSVFVLTILATLVLVTFSFYLYILPQPKTDNVFKSSNIVGLKSMDEVLNLPTQPTFTFEPTEFTFEYSQKRDFITLQDPSYKCKAYINTTKSLINSDIFLLIAVRSVCNNFKERKLIRETWGNETWINEEIKTKVRIVFVIGNCKKDIENVLLNKELTNFNDLLQFNVDEALRNLTRKDLLFMQWFLKNCRQIPFVYKGDDDVFLNLKTIISFLQEQKRISVLRAKNLALGYIMRHQKRQHNISHMKYYMPYNLYPYKYYPIYLSGTGQIYSSQVIEKLFNASLFLRIHPMDDAFEGSLMEAAGVTPLHDYRFRMWGLRSNYNMCNVNKQFLICFPKKKVDLFQVWKDFISYDYSNCNSETTKLTTEFLKLL